MNIDLTDGRAKKEARLLGVWPLATERDGGLSGSRYSRGSCAEGGSTGRGKLVVSGAVSGLEKFGSLQTTLEVSVLRPIPIASWKRFAIVCPAVNFTLQKNELPITWFCQFRICLVHFRPSLLFLYSTIHFSNRHTVPVNDYQTDFISRFSLSNALFVLRPMVGLESRSRAGG